MSENEKILIGFLVPEEVNDLFRLQGLIQGVNKSDLLRDIFMRHVEDNDWTVDNRIELCGRYLYTKWNLRYRDSTPFTDYRKRVRDDLENAKLPKRLISRIIKKCDELHKKNQSEKKSKSE